MMKDAIKNFHTQFAFVPKVINPQPIRHPKRIIVAGMGGSHLAGDLLKVWNPKLDVYIHHDYGLPLLPEEELKNSLIVASSYSGNTEETLDAFHEAQKNKLLTTVISTGGRLLELAKSSGVPYVELPETGIQPRMATGLGLKALFALLGETSALKELDALSRTLKPPDFESEGKKLATEMQNFVPVIYASSRNALIAYNWKIKFNETGKIPAFTNPYPELNENEMTGFDAKRPTKLLSERFFFIILEDEDDHPRNKKRMRILEDLYKDRWLAVKRIEMKGDSFFHKIFSSLVLADWTAFYTAENYGVDPEQVPMVEEFKKLMK